MSVPPPPDPAPSLPLSAEARAFYNLYAGEFAGDLLLTANEIAARARRTSLASDDVHAARELVYERRRRLSWKEYAFFFAGGLLGTGMQGFATEFTGGASVGLLGRFALR